MTWPTVPIPELTTYQEEMLESITTSLRLPSHLVNPTKIRPVMNESEWLLSSDPAAMLREGDRQLSRFRFSDRKLRLFACGCCRLVWNKLTDPRSRRAVGVAERYADGEASSKDRGLEMNKVDLIRSPTMYALAAACLRSKAGQAANEAVQFGYEYQAPAQAALLRDIFGNPFRPVESPWDYDEGGFAVKDAAWLAPDVLALAQAAYDERPGQRCKRCKGGGSVPAYTGMYRLGSNPCGECHGAGKVGEGLLDPVPLAILADALEEAGCGDEEILFHLRGIVGCDRCEGAGIICESPALSSRRPCPKCDGKGLVPPVPHVRGCWVIDLLLGKS